MRFWPLPLLFFAISVMASTEAKAQLQQQAEYVPGELIVKLKGKSKDLRSRAFIGKAVSEKSMTLKGSFSSLNMHHFAVKGKSVKEAIEELKFDPDVEYAEPNYIVRTQSTGPEGEPMALSAVRASSAVNASASIQTAAPIQQEEAWTQASDGLQPIIVAVIDTGVDYNHEVFVGSNAIWVNSDEIAGNGIDDDRNGFADDRQGWNFVTNSNSPMDDDGHGTHVAGIVLGATQDIFAETLQPAKIKIMPLKFLAKDGSGTTADAVKAIYYAVNNGAQVLNNSWGGGGYSNSLLEAMAYAYEKKVVFVAAAGNSGSNNDSSPTYPANYTVPNVISVAATTALDNLAVFSNYGAQTVHMGSPGVSIYSSMPNNAYQLYSGTSMAAPFVSGVAALVLREEPTLSGYEVKTLIFNGGNLLNSLAKKTTTQKRLNVLGALTLAKSAGESGAQPAFDLASQRTPSSEAQADETGACGLVAKSLYDSHMNGDGGGGALSGPQKNAAFFALLGILMAPILLAIALRNRGGKNQRRHERFKIESSVKVQVGEKVLVGSVSSISLGGVQLNTDAWLENGGIVKMAICSPDGKDEIQVEGKIVWSEEQKRYGVAFANADEPVLAKIMRWTQSLARI